MDQEFWGDRLEVDTELAIKEHNDDERFKGWAKALSPRCRAILVAQLRIDDDEMKLEDLRGAFFTSRADLLPYRLVDAAVQGKHGYALREVARTKLPFAAYEACRVKAGEDKFDRAAMAWSLYVENPDHLELVLHLDRTQRKGFARMTLDPAPTVAGGDVDAFLTKGNVQAILDRFETEKHTLRQSYCAAILHETGGNFRVFVKRDNKPAFVAHGAKNTFGFEREWIILEFEPDLRRVFICSDSPDVPLRLANRVASEFFATSVVYSNEAIVTSEAAVGAFLRSLVDDPEKLPLVELVVKNCGLDGSPQMRLNSQENESIASAVKQFGDTFGDPLAVVEDIESIKVYHFDKRIKMLFEVIGFTGYVVRYADQPLNGGERREFEKLMGDDYHINVLSTEKKQHDAGS